MKSIVLKVALICFGLTYLMWITPETGYAQIDQKAIVGVWLFDEGSGICARPNRYQNGITVDGTR